MEQTNPTPETTSPIVQDAEFKKRRTQKNWIVMALIMAGVALVWTVTMIKIQNGLSIAHPIGSVDTSTTISDTQPPPQIAKRGDKHVQ